MPTNPASIIKVADALVAAGDTGQFKGMALQAILRSAVSRFYYGAYHRAKEYAESPVFGPGIFDEYACPNHRFGPHQALWEWWFIDQEHNPTLSGLGTSLHGLRKLADYKIKQAFTSTIVQRADMHAKKIIQLVDDLEKTSTSTRATPAP